MWRVWIEIITVFGRITAMSSPSVWRVWIEILPVIYYITIYTVTLRVEGVD